MNEKEMLSVLSNIRIVLSRPKDAENVGSVCRAMKTMGLTDLRIVGTPEFDSDRAAAVAVHAADVLASCGLHESIEAAVADCTLVAGCTTRWGKKRKSARLTPVGLSERIADLGDATVAIVFGNESSGLDESELDACHVTVTIPSSPDSRSLNLSHAVQILCYEIYRNLHEASGKRFYTPVDGEKLGKTVASIRTSLRQLGPENERFVPLLRDILARSAPSAEEVKRLEGLFAKLAGMLRGRDT